MPGLHHISKRRRVYQKLEPFPHENKWINFLDKLLFVVAILGPVMILPQMWKIYSTKTAAGVSALSFGMLAFLSIPWVVYGVVHKSKQIIITYTLWVIANTIIAVGAIIHA